MIPKRRGLPALCVLLCLTACKLPGRAPTIRYFSVETYPSESEVPTGTERTESTGAVLRLRRLDAAGHLKERIVWRISEVESGFYEQRRWTEPPGEYLHRALAHELFEVRGLRSSESTRAPSLDVELLAFEELRASVRQARIVLVARLYGSDSQGLLERTFVETRRLEGDDPVELARALSRALRDVVEDVAGTVEAELAALGHPPPR